MTRLRRLLNVVNLSVWLVALSQTTRIVVESLQQQHRTIEQENVNNNDNQSTTTRRKKEIRGRFRQEQVPYLSTKERRRLKQEWEERQRNLASSGGEDNDYLNDLETWKHAWNYLHVVVVPQEAEVVPLNNNVLSPGQVLADNAAVTNIRGDYVGRSKQGCIRNTNFLCTWTMFLASITKSGCDVLLQGLYIPVQPLTSTGVPVDQFASIVGGTGPCRGITGEVKISPRSLSFPTLYDYELYYIIRG